MVKHYVRNFATIALVAGFILSGNTALAFVDNNQAQSDNKYKQIQPNTHYKQFMLSTHFTKVLELLS
jgi:hypothetical protein